MASPFGKALYLVQKVRRGRPIPKAARHLQNGDEVELSVPGVERRQWERLPIAVPFFIRANDSNGEEFVDFSTALNLSAGRLLLATRRHLDRGTAVSLETPAPLSEAQPPRASRYFRGKSSASGSQPALLVSWDCNLKSPFCPTTKACPARDANSNAQARL